MLINYSEQGKQNKKKGTQAESESAKFWSKRLDTNVKRTVRSGALLSWPGDLVDMGNSILQDFVIDSKYGSTAIPKKIEQYASKKGISIDVMLEEKRQYIMKSIFDELGLNSDATKADLDSVLISIDPKRANEIMGRLI